MRRPVDAALCDGAWSRPAAEVVDSLGSNAVHGLDPAEAGHRLETVGRNRLRERARRPLAAIVVDQFRSIVILLLLAASGLAFLFADNLEGLSILFVVLVNAGIGFLTEWRALRSMEALSRLGRVDTVVVRGGETRTIPAEELVPGDIVLREGGDIVTADMRLIEASLLQADESTLTGESLPVEKSTATLAGSTALMDRRNMLFKGTAVTRGSARAVVVGTGLDTELGRISELVRAAEPGETPLEKRLDALARRLVWFVLGISVVLAAGGIVVHDDLLLAVEVAIALAVAAIPEGLPIVATVALARGMWRMARRNALIARLSAVETLGATSVILTDKTGTLTENHMSVTAIEMPGHSMAFPGNRPADDPSSALLDRLLECAALCSNASTGVAEDGTRVAVGDPTEVALLDAAGHRGIDRARLLERRPETREFSFDPDTKLMATVHMDEAGPFAAVKGAPESVIARAEQELTASGIRPLDAAARAAWLETVAALGARGLRTLAIAESRGPGVDTGPYRDLLLLGIVALEDPPRPGVAEAVLACADAGVRVIMLTGDHLTTARKIAADVGILPADTPAGDGCMDGRDLDVDALDDRADALLDVRVFSRVTPEQKLALIGYYQRREHVVAMTGDGVNDAPALKKADIGVAMGRRGTAVAREAADMILQDDDFATIVAAVEQGRAIYENIRKFVVYLLSCNVSEVLAVALATAVAAPLPLLPLQILYLNLVTDVFPALALGVGEGAGGVMRRGPRPAGEPILTRRHWLGIAIYGAVISLTVLAAMAIAIVALGFEPRRAVTVSFCTLALAQLWHVINMRDSGERWYSNEITGNAWMWAAVLLCVVLVIAAVYLPGISDVLELSDPGAKGWSVIVAMSVLPVLLAPAVRALVHDAQRN